MNAKITKRVVDAANAGGRDTFIWDTETKGFGLKITRGGKKVYIFQYRWPGRRSPSRITIGNHGDPWTPDKARTQAERLRGDVKYGRDPATEKRRRIDEERNAITIAELCDRYLEDGCASKKASTIATDRGRIERHIKPLLGRKKVRDLTSNDVRRFLRDVAAGKSAAKVKTVKHGLARVTGGQGAATRTVGLLGGICSFAVAEGLRDDNPVRGVKRFPDRKGDRFLSEAELARLGEQLALAEAAGDNPLAVAALRLLVFTGCRKSEVLTLKWRHVDFERCCLRLEDSKTGEKTIPLGAPALKLLEGLPRYQPDGYVFIGRKPGRHLVGLPKFWERIRARAGLDDVRLHDLRHSFASVGAGAGMGLLIVGKLLGHRDPKTTSRYAHLADDPAKVAADRISGQIEAVMSSRASLSSVEPDEPSQLCAQPKKQRQRT